MNDRFRTPDVWFTRERHDKVMRDIKAWGQYVAGDSCIKPSHMKGHAISFGPLRMFLIPLSCEPVKTWPPT